ncbi:MAG: DnaJ domain-containing protein [Myxococcaceae bacterium]|nr:DnaJ domain-containing protein [Myxococcaceae bacterium]
MSDEVVQVWVRTEKAQVFGPLSPTSVELLLDNGVITGRVQVSVDGVNYVFPGRMPGVRMVFPKELWGSEVLPHTALDDQWAKVAAPLALPGAAPPGGPRAGAGAVPGGPVAGPGAAPRAGPGGPVAGPGARAQQQQRPINPVQVAAQARSQAPQARPMAPAMPPPRAPVAATSLEASLFDDVPASSPSQVASTPSGVRAVAPPPRPPVTSAQSMQAAAPAAPMRSSPSVQMSMAPPPGAFPGSSPSPLPMSTAAVAPLESLPPSGSLREVSAQRLYFLAAAQDVTGLLTFQLPDRALMLHFRKGSPDSVDSTHPEDALATFLLRKGLATPDALGQAQREGARFGGELLPALFGLGLVNPNMALEALAGRAGGIIGQALLATDGSFTFQPVDLPPHKVLPAGQKWQVYGEQLRRLPAVEVRARLHSALDYPVMRGAGPVPVTDLRLTAQETRAYALFDGTRTLNQLLNAQAPEAEAALRVAFMLFPCDLVSFAGTVVKTAAPLRSAAPPPGPPPGARPPSQAVPGNPVAPKAPTYPGAKPPGAAAPPPIAPPRPVVAPPAAPPPAAPPRPVVTAPTVGPAVVPPTARPAALAAPVAPPRPAPVASASTQSFDAEIKKLQDLALKMKSQNHFEVLAVTREAPANAVKIAYFKLAKDYHPDTVPPGAPEALSKAKADVFARIGDAHRTLSDESLKKDYIAELDAGGAGEKIDISKLLAAEELFQKGKLLVQARKFPEAVKLFDEAIAANAEEPEFSAWRGYARFFTFPDKKVGQTEAMKDITNCLKRNPNIVAAHFFQGMMAKLLGDLPAAKKHFNQTVKLDPKHIDAQRELRMMK